MKKTLLTYIPLLALILLPVAPVWGTDPSFFTIRIRNFSRRFYRQETGRFMLKSSSRRFRLVNSAFQKMEKQERGLSGNSLIVVTGVNSPTVPSPGKRDLEDTMFLNLHSSPVKKMADRFRKVKDKTAGIEKYVFSYINNKTIGIPLLSAEGIIASRSGDCTEHAILSLSLLRACGVPARAVVGVYLAEEFMGEKNVFVYHMWVEAYEKGRWKLVDATRPGENDRKRYIAFTYHSLKSPSPLSYLRAVSAIRDMEITRLD